MKKYLSILLVCLLLSLTGCQSQSAGWSVKKDSLLNFPFGCSVEEAVDLFGLSMEDVASQNQDGSEDTYIANTYAFDGTKALDSDVTVALVITEIVQNDTSLGVKSIQVRFGGEDALSNAESFFADAVAACPDAVKEGSRSYTLGDVSASYWGMPDLDSPTFVSCEFADYAGLNS
jgi:hypothetical protein